MNDAELIVPWLPSTFAYAITAAPILPS